jgi:hypothetical protein
MPNDWGHCLVLINVTLFLFVAECQYNRVNRIDEPASFVLNFRRAFFDPFRTVLRNVFDAAQYNNSILCDVLEAFTASEVSDGYRFVEPPGRTTWERVAEALVAQAYHYTRFDQKLEPDGRPRSVLCALESFNTNEPTWPQIVKSVVERDSDPRLA